MTGNIFLRARLRIDTGLLALLPAFARGYHLRKLLVPLQCPAIAVVLTRKQPSPSQLAKR
jgi:hypothetical protein